MLAPAIQERRCLDWSTPDSVVHFYNCGNSRPFVLTGPLETESGLALSTSAEDPLAGLSVVALEPGEPPGPGEEFDVHF